MPAGLPPRLTFITLAVRDMEAMYAFYKQFGWPEAPSSDQGHRVFQCRNGVAIALYPARFYEPTEGSVTEGFRAFTLCINARDWLEVESMHRAVSTMTGVTRLDEPERTAWGGGFSFHDPEGNVWDVALATGSIFDERDGLTFP